jgi:hypothetical protein
MGGMLDCLALHDRCYKAKSGSSRAQRTWNSMHLEAPIDQLSPERTLMDASW